MPRFTSKLSERKEVAERTMVFAFERPTGFSFRAGQFLILTLSDPPHNDAKGNRRTFSIASPPQEAGHLQIATRMTASALKRSLAEMALGTPVELFGPAGSFTLDQDSSPAVFIAGGIGITPFRSMVFDAVSRDLRRRITLVYSNRNPEGTAFHEEFRSIAEKCGNFRYLPTMTQPDQSQRPWDGERGYVNADFLRNHIRDVAVSIFYVAGPPSMVTAVTEAVIEAGADAARVHSEEFEGY